MGNFQEKRYSSKAVKLRREEIIKTLKIRHKFLRESFEWFEGHWTEKDFACDIPYRLREVDHILRHVPILPPARVLDVGVAGGQVLYCLRDLGYQVIGLDDDHGGTQSTDQFREHFLGVEVYSIPLEQAPWPFEPETFDAVISTHVIEHIPVSPKTFLQEIMRVLKPGSWAYLSTPNVVRLLNRLRAVCRKTYHPVDIARYFEEFGSPVFQGHVREFTVSELNFCVQEDQFQTRIWRNLQPPVPLTWSYMAREISSCSYCLGYLPAGLRLCGWSERINMLQLQAKR